MGHHQPPISLDRHDAQAQKDQEAKVHDLSGDSSHEQSGHDERRQAGVQNVEAITTVWSRTSLIIAYVLVWVVYFVMLMTQAASGALMPYVTSAFQSHSLTPTVSILSSVIGGVCNLTTAKILDIFGRPLGYALGLVIATIGLIMMAATNGVEMYAAAQVFWTVGYTAVLYTVNIFVADTTGLRNRGLMTGLTASPNIITIWLGGPIAEAFLKGPGWKWCYGALSIIVPVLCLPLFGHLMWNLSKAKKQGVVPVEEKPRALAASFLYYCREFDAVGLLLLTAGLALFLLPFNMYTLQPLGWRSPLIICLLVFGVVLMVMFAFWERFFAPVTFIPFSLLLNRNMAGACVLGAALFVSYYCWFALFGSFLQVVNNLSVTEASYVVQIYGLGSSLFVIAGGVYMRYTGYFKAITFYGALPVYTLFMGLMIHFRDAEKDVGFIIMCQIFISFAAGIIMITPQIAAMSASTHQDIAAVMAIVSMFSNIGGAIGSTVSGAIWQSVFPAKLAKYLPLEEQENLVSIYTMVEVQLSYPIGSPAHIAIQRAYADAQAMMLTAGTATLVLGFVAVALWRNTDIRPIKQVKGQVI